MFSLLLAPVVTLVALTTAPVSALWPIPQNYTNGSTTLYLDQNIDITYNGAFIPFVYGYQPTDFSGTQLVTGAVSRSLEAIFSAKFVPWMLHARNNLASFEPDVSKGQTWIKTLAISTTTVFGPNDTYRALDGDVDESYNMTISTDGNATLTAATSYGVLRGLETFTQLFYQHSSGTFWYTPYAPVAIQDAPKFPHRGIMFDVARTFYPVEDIYRIIEGMSWAKMNKLHIHATDSQAWPLDIPSMPELAQKGAYRPDWVYSAQDIENMQVFGAQRGVQVIFEIDMPGHIGSVAWSHPELITAFDALPYEWWCAEPPCGAFKLNDSAVYDFVDKLFDDLLPRVASYSPYFSTGGDELNANDSMLDDGVKSNSTEVLAPLLQKFIDHAHGKVRAAGLAPMVWEEMITTWGLKLGNDTTVQTWLGSSSVKNVTSSGLKVVDSDYNYWYLDCGRGQWVNIPEGYAYDTLYPFKDWCGPSKAWQLVYSHDPTYNLTADEAKLVMGGEVAVWSETIDSTNLDSLVWPRAAVAGEVLWSGRTDASGNNRTLMDASPRLNEMRSLMVARGIAAAPVQMTYCTQADVNDCAAPYA